MKKQITNLLVMPLIASAVFLASPTVFAASPTHTGGATEIRHKTYKEGANPKKGITGTVSSISGTIIIVTAKDSTKYTVDASHATIMKAADQANTNPYIVTTTDIKVGDAIMVRGVLMDKEITADQIFDGKMSLHKKSKNLKKA
jgi:hypothetical protein